MLTSHRKSQNYSQIRGGQTLFEFLKRKKKFALQLSLSKSRKQNIPPSQSYSPHKSEKVVRFQDTVQLDSNIKCNTYRSKYKQPQTSRNNSNVLGMQSQVRKTKQASFIEMISPLRRNKQDKSLTPEKVRGPKDIAYQDQQNSYKSKKKVEEVFYRKNLNNSINVMKQTLMKYMQDGKNIKNKAHTLFIQLKPILKFVQDGNNKNFSRRAQQLKLKLRTFEHMFKQFDMQNGNQILQKFHRNLSEHIISLQGKIRSEYQKNDIATLNKIREQKDNKIIELKQGKAKLEKQLDIISRKLDKSQRQFQKLQQQQQANSTTKNDKFSSKATLYEQKIQQYESQLEHMAKQLDNSRQRQKTLQKKLKDAVYLKQEAQHRFIQENTKIKSTKQQYLLNQIDMIKQQFKNDMKQLNTLYIEKQQDQLRIIEKQRKQIEEYKQINLIDRQRESRILEDNKICKVQVEKYQKQNQCLVTDMNRMNQQLYQHWLALKDVKTLAHRLQIFDKFVRIYSDLAFNDTLFV